MIDPDRDLWRAVIIQAISDICLGRRVDQSRVLAWAMARQSTDFTEVCDLAGLDPSKTRSTIESLFRMEKQYRRYYYQRLTGWLKTLEGQEFEGAPGPRPGEPAPPSLGKEGSNTTYADQVRGSSAADIVPCQTGEASADQPSQTAPSCAARRRNPTDPRQQAGYAPDHHEKRPA